MFRARQRMELAFRHHREAVDPSIQLDQSESTRRGQTRTRTQRERRRDRDRGIGRPLFGAGIARDGASGVGVAERAMKPPFIDRVAGPNTW